MRAMRWWRAESRRHLHTWAARVKLKWRTSSENSWMSSSRRMWISSSLRWALGCFSQSLSCALWRFDWWFDLLLVDRLAVLRARGGGWMGRAGSEGNGKACSSFSVYWTWWRHAWSDTWRLCSQTRQGWCVLNTNTNKAFVRWGDKAGF